MGSEKYVKPALSFDEKIALLESRGLIIGNKNRAKHLLENISYYRLSGYFYPLLADKSAHIFKKGSTFTQAFKMYCFDRELRLLIMGELEKIEVSLRSQISYNFSHIFGTSYWFENPAFFEFNGKKGIIADGHAKLLEAYFKEYFRSDELFVSSFKDKYTNKFPPCWILLELVSLNTLSRSYKNIKSSQAKDAVAAYYDVPTIVLQSWLHALTTVRKVCAHHSRFWNREFGVAPARLKKGKGQWINIKTAIDNNRAFYILSVILYLLLRINPKTTFKKKIKNLLLTYPTIDITAMGFPKLWEHEEIWKN